MFDSQNANVNNVMKIGGQELAKVLMYFDLIPDLKSEQKILCPFHPDENPSMIVKLVEGQYFCFGCQESGDALKFVQTMYRGKLNDLEACKLFVEILKSDKVRCVKVSRMHRKRKDKQEAILKSKMYYYGLKTIDWENDNLDEVIECGDYMEQRGFTKRTLTKCKAKVTFNKMYPIIFPMKDNGTFKGWVSRTTNKRIEKRRKYLYNEGFSRATTLCGTYDDKSPVYIVEGYMDMLKLKQFGVRNVVAILGWKISREQIDKLKRCGVKHVVSALDNDECGNKGSKYLRNYFKVTRFCYQKGIKDPGEMNVRMFNKMNSKTLKEYRGGSNNEFVRQNQK